MRWKWLLILLVPVLAFAAPVVIGPPSGQIIGSPSPCTNAKIAKTSPGLVWECADDAGAASGAPTDATYITKTANGSLSAEAPLSAIATGLLINETGTGNLSAYAGATCTDTFIRSVNGSGVVSCAKVAVADFSVDMTTQAELDAHLADAADAHAASAITNTPSGTTSSTTVQAAINELAGDITTNAVNLPTTNQKAAMADSAYGTDPTALNLFVVSDDTRLPSMSTPTPLSVSSQINCNAARTIYIEGTSALTLTSNPPIIAGTYAGQRCSVLGKHQTNTVTIPNGNTLRHCGNTGSVVVGLNKEAADYEWTGAEWAQDGCMTLERSKNVGPNMTLAACGTATNPTFGDLVGGNYFELCLDTGNVPTLKGFCSGLACDTTFKVEATKVGNFYSNADLLATITESTDTWSFAAGHLALRGGTGVPTGGDCDAAGEARRVWLQTDASAECMVWTCRGAAGWANQCGTKTACTVKDAVTAADDNKLFGSFDKAITVKSAWCHYEGSAPSTGAQFQLVGMTHTPPTCAGPTAAASKQTVSAGNTVAVQVPVRFSVTNTPNPATDAYSLCFAYDIN